MGKKSKKGQSRGGNKSRPRKGQGSKKQPSQSPDNADELSPSVAREISDSATIESQGNDGLGDFSAHSADPSEVAENEVDPNETQKIAAEPENPPAKEPETDTSSADETKKASEPVIESNTTKDPQEGSQETSPKTESESVENISETKTEASPEPDTEKETEKEAEEEAKVETEEETMTATEEEAKGETEEEAKDVTEEEAMTATEEEAMTANEEEAMTATEEEAKDVTEEEVKVETDEEVKVETDEEVKVETEEEAKVETEEEAKVETDEEPKTETGVEPVIPPALEESFALFSEDQKKLCMELCEAGQSHLFEHWPNIAATESASSRATDNIKRRMVAQLEALNSSYSDGGLIGYIGNAKKLLDASKKGINPLEGWKPSVPTGKSFNIGSTDYADVEQAGLQGLGRIGFVLVAGGLGERLGYGGIKIGLPTEMATETLYIQYYIETILAYQRNYAAPGVLLPLCIMTSNDTNNKTVQLLKEKSNFGMVDEQITIVQQGEGVPALSDNDARIALDPNDGYKILTKPHGHGDIHALMYTHSVAKKWIEEGIEWAVFFQDTNGLAFHSMPLALGVSVNLELVMNSITVPRKAKQAIGGIAKLENEKGEKRTVNVEYNQLDPLLRSSGEYPDGDMNDEATGHSPFPGNINQLLFKLGPYGNVLEKTKGVMPEFVNPKYKDAEKTTFKKPTRLECMMQDFPTVLVGEDADKVGFTSIAPEICFSPVKNATKDGVVLQQKNTPPGVAATGEADQYGAFRAMMRSIGCQIEDAEKSTFDGIDVVLGPQIVLKPDFVCCPAEYCEKFPTPSNVKISSRSSLVVKGSGVKIESLDLDGALVIECEEGASGVISDLVVKNEGWVYEADDSSSDEVIAMRGYKLRKVETENIVFNLNDQNKEQASSAFEKEVVVPTVRGSDEQDQDMSETISQPSDEKTSEEPSEQPEPSGSEEETTSTMLNAPVAQDDNSGGLESPAASNGENVAETSQLLEPEGESPASSDDMAKNEETENPNLLSEEKTSEISESIVERSNPSVDAAGKSAPPDESIPEPQKTEPIVSADEVVPGTKDETALESAENTTPSADENISDPPQQPDTVREDEPIVQSEENLSQPTADSGETPQQSEVTVEAVVSANETEEKKGQSSKIAENSSSPSEAPSTEEKASQSQIPSSEKEIAQSGATPSKDSTSTDENISPNSQSEKMDSVTAEIVNSESKEEMPLTESVRALKAVNRATPSLHHPAEMDGEKTPGCHCTIS